jgi:20S proteasome alpha/beta subunit
MTTIIGYVTDNGNEVILATDRQSSIKEQGFKQAVDKIIIGKNKRFCFAMSGLADENSYELVNMMKEGDFDMEKAIQEEDFPKLRELNLTRWDGRIPRGKDSTSFFIASIFDETPKLHTIWPLGRIEERSYTWMGSGQKYVQEYLKSKSTQLQAEQGINLLELLRKDSASARQAVFYALGLATSQDIYSSGIDVAIIRKENIVHLGKELKQMGERLDQNALEKILKA